ncbi:MAG: tautomerase family protein [Deltaproteobacteria bacterium]|nr:tautomerase family protein [Deltaproteobacteria bacterium]MBI3079701.1 tautomerase family protein [Deltaproteobacteria bacterium]
MPVVQIHLWEGRSKQQKAELVRLITESFQKAADVSPEALHIIFNDVKKDNWGHKGKLASE